MRLLAAIPLLLAAAAVGHYVDDLRARGPAEEFMARYSFDLRRPAEVETMRLAPSSDAAMYIAADAAVADVLGSVNLSKLDAKSRRAWLDSVATREEALEEAKQQAAEALATRPGWPYHAAVAGRIAYLQYRNSDDDDAQPSPRVVSVPGDHDDAPTRTTQPSHDGAQAGMPVPHEGGAAQRSALSAQRSEQWYALLRHASTRAPGDDSVATFLAGAILESQQRRPITPADEPVLARAFHDPRFVSRAFFPALAAFGPDRAAALVPDDAAPLRVAVRQASAASDAALATTLYRRWVPAEWRARSEELREIERYAAWGDTNRTVTLCAQWVSRHVAGEFDSPEGRAQVMRLLELWPARPGAWGKDRRADLVRFFLAGRIDDASRAVVARTVDALSGVPPAIAARAAVVGGNDYGAERIVDASGAAASFEWTPVFAEMARRLVSEKRIEKAEEALLRIAPAARNECDVLIVRRELARAKKDEIEEVLVDADLRLAAADLFAGEAFTTMGLLSLCIDPDRSAGRALRVEVAAAAPALVRWGWNGGVAGSARLSPGTSTLSIPLEGLSGRHVLALDSLAGGPVTPVGARIE